MTDRELSFRWLGLLDYEEALSFQYASADKRAAGGIPDSVFFLEHNEVITMGRRGHEEHILVERDELKRQEIDVHRITRGGEVTYHGPGQLVGYIIFNIRSQVKQVARLVHGIEHALIDFLRDEYGIAATSDEQYPGVWLCPEHTDSEQSVRKTKIASVGISIHSGVTIHGFALNVATNLQRFSYIVACGMADIQHSSIVQEVQQRAADTQSASDIPLSRVATQLQPHLAKMHSSFFRAAV